ncbi:MAG: aminotransferase class V-fold PLP-dependent enzyme [Streptosporangiales bacterium]|nr:aminotransferase class V-fold PLP-dependent enzyme [Streptosporangiales bacterium]
MNDKITPSSEEATYPASPSRLSRRGLLGMLGAGAATVGGGLAFPTNALAAPPRTGTSAELVGRAADDAYWRRVRRLFTLSKDSTFMNVGTVGSPPREVLAVYDETNREVARGAVSAYSGFDDVRAHAADSFGCDPDEVALSHNTSDGLSKVLAGLDLREGDEILTTNHEHGGGLVPMALLQNRHGVVVRKVAVPVGNDQRAEDYVELFRQAIGPRTKVMLFSAPTYKTGTMLPIRMLAELAQEHGLTSVVDAAHVPGMMAYEYRALGVDFIAGSCAKWQCGPAATGLIYIRNKVLPEHNPNPLPAFWPVVSSSYPQEGGMPPRSETGEASYDIGLYLTSVGNGSLATMTALDATYTVWERIGRKRVETYVVGLADRLKRKAAERWGVKALYSPMDDDRLTCALTSFNPFQNPADITDEAKSTRLVERVRDEYGYTLRNVGFDVIGSDKQHFPVRISTHLFHNADDVDGVVAAVWKVSKSLA